MNDVSLMRLHCANQAKHHNQCSNNVAWIVEYTPFTICRYDVNRLLQYVKGFAVLAGQEAGINAIKLMSISLASGSVSRVTG
jgi:hypothetical protein